MKQKIYISILLASFVLFLGSEVTAKLQSKTPVVAQMQMGEKIDFVAYVNGQTLNLEFDRNLDASFTVELFNITGKRIGFWKIQKAANLDYEIDLNQLLANGLYIIKITSGQHEVVKKMQV